MILIVIKTNTKYKCEILSSLDFQLWTNSYNLVDGPQNQFLPSLFLLRVGICFASVKVLSCMYEGCMSCIGKFIYWMLSLCAIIVDSECL